MGAKALLGRLGVLSILAAGAALIVGAQNSPPPGAPGVPPSPGAQARKDIVGTEKKLYSQSDEELIIRDFFQDRRKGYFLDVGCAWPIRNSNTHYLEKHLNWKGIGVDGLPEYAQTWRYRRPKSKFFNFIVTDHSDTVETFYRSELAGISATRPLKDPGGRDVKVEEIKVPTITLTKLLDQNGVKKLDFLSMDIEGGELLALAGFDIDRFKPELACIEAHRDYRPKILEYFAAHGYLRLEQYIRYDEVNYYFAPKAAAR